MSDAVTLFNRAADEAVRQDALDWLENSPQSEYNLGHTSIKGITAHPSMEGVLRLIAWPSRVRTVTVRPMIELKTQE